MARLFTIPFSFEQQQYDAQITVDDAAETNAISVYVQDASLHQYIPSGKVVWQVDEALTPLQAEAPAAERLKHSIIAAFKTHESQSPPVNMW